MAYSGITYNDATLRQNLLDIIKDVSPNNAPFAQMFPLSKTQKNIFGNPILYKLLSKKYER